MLKYNIKTAIRNIFRLKSNTVIGLSGLAVGFACVFIISAWTIQELNFDRFHINSKSIYMVTTKMEISEGNYVTVAETPSALAQELKNKIPEIKQSCHFTFLYGGREIKSGNNNFSEVGIASDSKLLMILNFPLSEGNIEYLEQPNSIFLTEKLAQKLFPNVSPLGKNVEYQNNKLLTVKGVIKNIPENSSIKFDFIVSYQTEFGNNTTWSQFSDATLIKISSSADISQIQLKANSIWRDNVNYKQYTLNLSPITKLRYGSNFDAFYAEHGNYLKLYSFIVIALLILILASLNYANLISAYSIKRVDEVSVRKINGASFNNILKGFLVESVINSIIIVIIVMLLSALCKRLFQYLLAINITLEYLITSFVAVTIVIFFIVGIISGLYPAIITSSASLFSKKQNSKSSPYNVKLKSAFALSQFILSITLTIISIIIIRQTNYLNRFDVGYNPKNIIHVYMPPEGLKNFETIRNELLSSPNIKQVSFSRASIVSLGTFFKTDKWDWEGVNGITSTSINCLDIDDAYLDVFQIPILEGQNFSATKNNNGKVIINEKLADLLGSGSPVGKILRQGKNDYEVIGIVKDFHFQNLSNHIEPLLFTFSNKQNRMYVKVAYDLTQGVDAVRKQFSQFYHQPFNYSLEEEHLKELYANENRISLGIIVFAILSIILSCVGLIGMMIFSNEMKMKEIGVRKVCGATFSEIAISLNRDIIKWFVLGFIISCGLSWYLMSKWLENFAFKAPLSWWVYILGAGIVLSIVFLTLTNLTVKAAKTNPVDSLKYE